MDPAQLQPGYRLDRYELLCPLAYGGMASVWLARFGGRLGFERLVVVKMILPQYSQDPRFQEMFLDEARIASKIEHGNVARILDVGEHEENYFIVMEWVDGDSLSKVLRAAEAKKQRVPAGIALKVCADAAAGLHAAHMLRDRDGSSLGVVHRDVSPQNILIANTGATMLIDFGVAKARDRVSQETSAGQLKGKIRYMAPEQAVGRDIDLRADVWALGAMLYELFAGSPPYDGPNEVATLHKLTSGATPAPLPKTVPQEVRAVIERALAYSPSDRFETALELNLALEGAMVLIGEPTSNTVVAHYTGQLLADRKAARRKAVDNALAQAQKRDAGKSSQIPASTSSGISSIASLSDPAMPLAMTPSAPAVVPSTPSLSAQSSANPISGRPGPISDGPHSHPGPRSHSFRSDIPIPIPDPHEPSSVPSQGPMGLAEVPSATSSATLGSANIDLEYPPPQLADDGIRRRRYVGAAILGISLAAGVVGAVLIISTAVLKHGNAEPPRTLVSPTETAVVGAAPPPAAAPTPTLASTTIELPDTQPEAAPSASASGAASAVAAPAPSDSTKKDPPIAANTGTGTHNRGTPAAPPPPPPPKPKTTPTPPPNGGRVDRGF